MRFSSIGDVVLTTPILRSIKQQLQNVTVHFLTKQNFLPVIENNPYVDQFFAIKHGLEEVVPQLKKESYDYVIDLHHNLRTFKLKRALGQKAFSFNKLNLEKFLMVNFKINRLPNQHIVDRYYDTVKALGVTNDHKGLDYFIHEKDEITITNFLPTAFHNGYHVLVAGGSYFTKQIPLNKLKEFCNKSTSPVVLLGGKEDADVAELVHQTFPKTTLNLCGKLNINQSASIIRQAKTVITSDTGLMHIAAAFKKNIISVWGNTIPEFGMGPYMPGEKSLIVEVKNLPCRPCSKLGYPKCPRRHFKCMNDIVVPRPDL
ncbi:MAG: glycosyltransferase family 9 protein [Bacteroidota bacterium]|nr:glycosyltransferase family 9 protein [Bacteroidota bacterium]